jgi:N-acetyl sugar amidotransferase
VKRCLRCVIPDTRPDTAFVDGVCSACLAYEKRPQVDWDARKKELLRLLDKHGGRCIVPSSGGKDSTYQALTLLDLGADVTVVTATTCHLTEIGRANIENLARYAKTIQVTPNRTVRAKLNRMGLVLVGDISWPEHVAIFTTPFRIAGLLGIPLIFYGESPQNQYGGPIGTEEANQLTRRWRSEFGGFLGLRPSDCVGQGGITERDMEDYTLPEQDEAEAYFLGQFIPWDSHRNARVALAAGMKQQTPSAANWWGHENLDNAQTGLHDYGMYLKYGFGRGAAQISVDVRSGLVSHEEAMAWVRDHDGEFPEIYAGVPLDAVLDRIGMKRGELMRTLDQFTNNDLFRRVIDDAEAPMLRIA